ncbi:MAG TPA: hypothetical protein VK539_26170 [Myxococcaceae bacterium]|jgi:hypothetical protein|nr:hypothetical protein [Myxococcaceae bacterium]
MSYPAYQCFKTTTDQVYCSRTKVRNHAIGASWVSSCIMAHAISSATIRGKPYLSDRQPDGAIIYPE